MSFKSERAGMSDGPEVKIHPATSAARPVRPPVPTKPWKLHDPTGCPDEVKKAFPNHRPRWIRCPDGKDTHRLQEKADQGYVLATRPNKKGLAPGGLDACVDGSDITSAYRRRDCVLMLLPPELAQARDYYQWQVNESEHGRLNEPIGSIAGADDEAAAIISESLRK